MKISTATKEPGILAIVFEGDLDYHISADLRGGLAKILEGRPGKIMINLEKVNYMDSSGIAAFVEFSQKAKTIPAKTVFVGLTPPVLQVFTLAKLNLFFTLTDSEASALKILA